MSQLSLIVKTEFLTEVRTKSFWIGTILVPVIMILFGVVFGYLMAQSDTSMSMAEKLDTSPDPDTMTPAKVVGMMMGMFLTFFLMICGGSIFNKVKNEKTNRIMEIMATCVPGKTMMLAKIIAVGLISLVQILVWGSFVILGLVAMIMLDPGVLPFEYLFQPRAWLALIYLLLYFIGGYVLYGSLYACCGAITDKDNENQAYMTGLTFILLATFYLGQFAVDNGSSALATICTYIPFTSPTVGIINAITGVTTWWQTLISIVILFASAYVCILLAGKLYRTSLLFKGKQFTPKDIITFIRAN